MWSWVLAFVGILAMYLVGRKHWYGWLVGLVAEFLWFFYSIKTQQWGFIVAGIVYSVVYTRNLLAWRNEPVLQSDTATHLVAN